MALSKKQQIFCREYLIDLNGAKAAVRAGYKRKGAKVTASRMLTNVNLKREIQRLMNERVARTQITGDKVLSEVARMAFLDAGEFSDYKIRGPQDIKKLPEDVRRCIVGWRYTATGYFNLLLADKVRSLELYGKHLKLFTDKIEIEDKTPPENKVPVVQATIKALFAELKDAY